jgi:hypothetical protein
MAAEHPTTTVAVVAHLPRIPSVEAEIQQIRWLLDLAASVMDQAPISAILLPCTQSADFTVLEVAADKAAKPVIALAQLNIPVEMVGAFSEELRGLAVAEGRETRPMEATVLTRLAASALAGPADRLAAALAETAKIQESLTPKTAMRRAAVRAATEVALSRQEAGAKLLSIRSLAI